MAKKMTIQEIMAMADEVRHLSMDEMKALPNMLGKIAPVQVAANGFYSYTNENNKKICIVARA